MDILKVALPLFFGLALLEMVMSMLLAGGYAKSDAMTNLGVGVLQQLSVVIIGFPFLVLYIYIWEHASLLSLSSDSIATWIFAILVYEAMYYFFHRLSHRVNLLWTAHQLHHSAETMNMTVGIRLSALGVLYHWIWDLPLALLGIPPVVFLVVRAGLQIYQLWFHTDLVPSVPVVERYLMTPSLHRVHHGRNERYIDKNFGAISTVCDRLFATYETEHLDDPIRYGTKETPKTSAPLPLQIECFSRAARLFRGAPWNVCWRTALASPSASPGGSADLSTPVRRPGIQLARSREIGAFLLLLGCAPLVAGFHRAVHGGVWFSVGVTLVAVPVILWVIGSALDGRLRNHGALGLAAASAMLVTSAVAWHTSSLAMTICGLLWGAGFLLMLLPMGARDNQSREAPRNLADAEGRQ